MGILSGKVVLLMCYNCKYDIYDRRKEKYVCSEGRQRPGGDICHLYVARRILVLPIGRRGNVYK